METEVHGPAIFVADELLPALLIDATLLLLGDDGEGVLVLLRKFKISFKLILSFTKSSCSLEAYHGLKLFAVQVQPF